MLFFLLNFYPVFSFADDASISGFSPVTESVVKIQGRAFFNRQSHDTLRLACVDSNDQCQNFRFMLELNDRKLFWFGPEFKANNDSELKLHLRALSNKAHLRKSTQRTVLNYGGGFLIAIASVWLDIKMNSLTPSVVAALATFGPAIVERLKGNTESDATLLPDIGDYGRKIYDPREVSEVTLDQNGWNWPSEKNIVGDHFFNELLSAISPHDHQLFLQH